MAQPLPIAGWYPDPEVPGHDRWWDGATWSENRRPSAAAGAASAAPFPPTAATRDTAPTQPHAARLYIPGEPRMIVPPASAYAPAPVVRNNLALIGFILSLSGFVLPFVLNSFAGGIVSAMGLRQSKKLEGTGILSNGRGLSIAGILIGFIWGGLCLIVIAGSIAFYFWVLGTAANFQYPDSPVG